MFWIKTRDGPESRGPRTFMKFVPYLRSVLQIPLAPGGTTWASRQLFSGIRATRRHGFWSAELWPASNGSTTWRRLPLQRATGSRSIPSYPSPIWILRHIETYWDKWQVTSEVLSQGMNEIQWVSSSLGNEVGLAIFQPFFFARLTVRIDEEGVADLLLDECPGQTVLEILGPRTIPPYSTHSQPLMTPQKHSKALVGSIHFGLIFQRVHR